MRGAAGLVMLVAGIAVGCTDEDGASDQPKSTTDASSNEALAASYAASVCGHLSACGDVQFTATETGPVKGSRTSPLTQAERPTCERERREELLTLLRCSAPTDAERASVRACAGAYEPGECPADDDLRACASALNGDATSRCPVFEQRAACDVLLLLAERCPEKSPDGASGP